MAMFDYDEETTEVFMCDEVIGKLRDRSVLRTLRLADNCMASFSQSLLRAIHYYTIDFNVCPRCKGEFYAVTRVNDVEIGHCSECRVPLYRFEYKVYIIHNNKTGARTWHNLLAR